MAIIRTTDIPQADLIWDVARVPEALAYGMLTPSAIASYLGGKVERHGLYYVQAATTLGLACRNVVNRKWEVTGYGRMFMGYDRAMQKQTLCQLMHEREPLQSLVEQLRAAEQGLTRDEIARAIQRLAPLSYATAHRRAQTITIWLCDLDLAKKDGQRLVYCDSLEPVADV